MASTSEKVFPDVYAQVRGTSQDPDLEHDGTKPLGYGMFWSERPGAPALETTTGNGNGRHRRKRG